MGSEPRNAVLEHAQGADDRAIHTPENKRDENQSYNDAEVQGQYGRQELKFGHPSKISVQNARDIQKQESDSYPEQPSQSDANLLKHSLL